MGPIRPRTLQKGTVLKKKLADTGRVVKLVQEAAATLFDVYEIRGDKNLKVWRRKLEREREARMEMYEKLMADVCGLGQRGWWRGFNDKVKTKLGRNGGEVRLSKFLTRHDTNIDPLQILTLLKHGWEKYGDLLTPRELDMMSTVFDWVVRCADIVIGTIPNWFTTTRDDWPESERSSVIGEEACLRQVGAWSKLQHPHVCKLYGACHVGVPLVVHQRDFSEYNNFMRKRPWKLFHGWAMGLQYVNERGMLYQRLSLDTLQSVGGVIGGTSVLSGLELQELRADKVSRCPYTKTQMSAPANVLTFGLILYSMLSRIRRKDTFTVNKLPANQPDFVNDHEWDLLCGMCASQPDQRLSLIEIVHMIKDLADDEARSDKKTDIVLMAAEDVATYVFPLADQSIVQMLQQVDDFCDHGMGSSELNRSVYFRLLDIYKQLVAIAGVLEVQIIEDYCSILWRFQKRLERQSSECYSETASVCASRTLANRNYGIQHDISRLICEHRVLNSVSPVHQWKGMWERIQRQKLAELKSCAESPSGLLDDLSTVTERSEAQALIQYETGRPLTPGFENLPRWFIPSYQVELVEYIANGSFGSVYHARWNGADVVVKHVLTDQSDPINRKQFRREVDLWFSLNHPNLIKLYGACHEGQPFFVCERASKGTILSFFTQNEERKTDRMWAWAALWRAASGLAYLHHHGIVHGDLKGNNILVSWGGVEVKLTDFGLSFLSESAHDDQDVGTGAVRWKAPECLLGARPTFASDIYSFGMCIIEAITGEYPWGFSMPDESVIYNVTKQQQIPSRPTTFNDEEWTLIECMCAYNPEARIDVATAVYLMDSMNHS